MIREYGYALGSLGILILYRNKILYYIHWLTGRILVKRNLRILDNYGDKKSYEGWEKNLNNLIVATGVKKFFKSPKEFLLVSLMGGVAMGIPLVMIQSWDMVIFVSCFVTITPYLILKVKLNSLRVGYSTEGILIVRELSNNYKIYSFNMEETLNKTLISIKDELKLKKLMVELTRQLQKSSMEYEIREALERFKYSLGTCWAEVLASNIFFAYYLGMNVKEGLDDLCKALEERKNVIEKNQRENRESKLIILYVAPLTYIFTFWTAIEYFGFSFKKFFSYQFLNPLGLKWAIIMIITYIASFLVYEFVRSEKVDI